MKVLHKTVFFSALALFLAFGARLNAQNCGCTTYGPLKASLGELVVAASRAQGTAQQVSTFASNGNANQLARKITKLSNEMSDIQTIGNQIVQFPVSDRLIYLEMRNLSEQFSGDVAAFNAIYRANNAGIVVIADALRASLNAHKGGASEIRIGICCRD